MTGGITTRPLTAADERLLRSATLHNLNWTGERRFTDRDLDRDRDLGHYARLRPERGDFGLVAARGGATAGVVWLLFLDGDDRGYGYLADGVPELSVCVWPGQRGQGIGAALLRAALVEARRRGLARVSLSVEAGNPAVRLYRRMGFAPVPGAAEGTMAVEL